MAMKAPSTLLLRALLRPQQPLCQVRWKSNWMPREKYAKITALDKLHRRQRAARRAERQASVERAAKMYPDTPSPAIGTPAPTSTPSSSSAPTLLTQESRSRLETRFNIPVDKDIVPTLSSLPYNILRTSSKNLPVYESTKGGGTKRITTIQKIQGNLTELATSVREALGLEPHFTDQRGRKKANIMINHTTKHVVIRGWRAPEIKRWAEVKGF